MLFYWECYGVLSEDTNQAPKAATSALIFRINFTLATRLNALEHRIDIYDRSKHRMMYAF